MVRGTPCACRSPKTRCVRQWCSQLNERTWQQPMYAAMAAVEQCWCHNSLLACLPKPHRLDRKAIQQPRPHQLILHAAALNLQHVSQYTALHHVCTQPAMPLSATNSPIQNTIRSKLQQNRAINQNSLMPVRCSAAASLPPRLCGPQLHVPTALPGCSGTCKATSLQATSLQVLGSTSLPACLLPLIP